MITATVDSLNCIHYDNLRTKSKLKVTNSFAISRLTITATVDTLNCNPVTSWASNYF
jgi:hypothetical protein